MAPSLRRKSGVNTSMVVPGASARTARMTSAKCPAPPSSRSSRSTDVTTTWESPSSSTASATCSGSYGSSRSGFPVATLQKAQARVQTLPRIITVACFCFQHSPMFGQAASSHTVCRLRRRMRSRVSWYSRDIGAFTRNHSGLRGAGWTGLSAFSGCRRAAASDAAVMELYVDRAAVGGKHRLMHHLRQRRMREDRMHQLRLGRFQRAGDAVALDQFGYLGADHMGAQEFSRLGVEHGLHHSLRLSQRDRLAVADEGEAPDLHLLARRLGRLLRQADARDLRPAIGAAGDLRHIQRMQPLHAGDLFDTD